MEKLFAYIKISIILFLTSCNFFSGEKTDNGIPNVALHGKYTLENAPLIGEFEGIEIFEGGISGITYIPGTDMEFYLINDRGPNLVMTEHHLADGQNVKVFPFVDYAPKIFRAKLKDGRFFITETLPIKNPEGKPVSGLPFPGNLDMNREIAWSDLNATQAGEDIWGIDAEGIVIGNDNDFWIVEEYRTSIMHLDKNGQIKTVYGPEIINDYYLPIDTVFKYRRPNRGFESVAITPSGLVYAMLQSPMWNPGPEISEASKLVRILELNPETGKTRMFLYEHSDTIDDVRVRDWKIADMVAVNDYEFLIIEHATRNESQFMDVYKIDISNATAIEAEFIEGNTPEQLINAETAAIYGINVVERTHLFDMISAGYDPFLDKPEGITIIDELTIALINDNDYDIDAPERNERVVSPGMPTCLYIFKLSQKLNFKR